MTVVGMLLPEVNIKMLFHIGILAANAPHDGSFTKAFSNVQ